MGISKCLLILSEFALLKEASKNNLTFFLLQLAKISTFSKLCHYQNLYNVNKLVNFRILMLNFVDVREVALSVLGQILLYRHHHIRYI